MVHVETRWLPQSSVLIENRHGYVAHVQAHVFLETKLHHLCHLTMNTVIQMAIRRCLCLGVKGGNVDSLGKKLT